MTRPIALTVIAWLFIMSGVAAIISMAVTLLIGHGLNLDLNVFCLGIGSGLLRMEERHRRWALWYVRFGLVSIPIVAVLFGLAAPEHVRFRFFSQLPFGTLPRSALIVVLSLTWVLALWEHTVLQRPDVRELFVFPDPRSGTNAMPPSTLQRLLAASALVLGALWLVGFGYDFHLHFDLNGGVGERTTPGAERRVVVLEDARGRRWVSPVDSAGNYSLAGWRPRLPAALFVCNLDAPAHPDSSAISFSGTDWVRAGISFRADQAEATCRELAI